MVCDDCDDRKRVSVKKKVKKSPQQAVHRRTTRRRKEEEEEEGEERDEEEEYDDEYETEGCESSHIRIFLSRSITTTNSFFHLAFVLRVRRDGGHHSRRGSVLLHIRKEKRRKG